MIYALKVLAQPPHLQGFGSAAQVPASYFKRRKLLRVRIAKIVEAAAVPPTRDGTPKDGCGPFGVDGRRTPTVAVQGNALGEGEEMGRLHQGSDGGWDMVTLVLMC